MTYTNIFGQTLLFVSIFPIKFLMTRTTVENFFTFRTCKWATTSTRCAKVYNGFGFGLIDQKAVNKEIYPVYFYTNHTSVVSGWLEGEKFIYTRKLTPESYHISEIVRL